MVSQEYKIFISSLPNHYGHSVDCLWMSLVCAVATGMLIWPIIEYATHRWLFHLKPPDSIPFLITVHFCLHGLHHKVYWGPQEFVSNVPTLQLWFAKEYIAFVSNTLFKMYCPILRQRKQVKGNCKIVTIGAGPMVYSNYFCCCSECINLS